MIISIFKVFNVSLVNEVGKQLSFKIIYTQGITLQEARQSVRNQFVRYSDIEVNAVTQ